jgi:hypothetical protein
MDLQTKLQVQFGPFRIYEIFCSFVSIHIIS